MRKRAGAVVLAVTAAFMFVGCRHTETAGDIKTYYAAIERGAYYEDWAHQLEEAAQMHGLEFGVGYADYNESIARELMEMCLKTGRQIDCVAANNDDMALGAVTACDIACQL